MQRDSFNAIVLSSLDPETRERITALVADVAKAHKLDEHGGWEFGIGQLTSKRSRALNWALYGYGQDLHSAARLAVIQVRQWTQGKHWNTVRKSYFLLGENEDQTVFAHPVESRVIHAAINADRDVVLACQNWIFGGDYSRMIRQGDLALVPLNKAPAAERLAVCTLTILDSHHLKATQIRQNGHTYAKNPVLTHQPGTHPQVTGAGWYRLVIGKRADFWHFAKPTVD